MASWSSFLFSSAHRSPTIGLAITLALVGAALVAPGGCSLNTAGISGTGAGGDSTTTTTTSTMVSTTTSTSTTSATSTSTGPVSCKIDDDCGKAQVGSCMKKVCSSTSTCMDEVDTANVPTDDGDPCTQEICSPQGLPHPGVPTGAPCVGKTGVCDNAGLCVGCLKKEDCTTSMAPACDIPTHTCVSCFDGIKNGTETGKDCGGDCRACNGIACSTNVTCASDKCVDGVCCETDCNGACQACNMPASPGTCSSVLAGQLDAACGNTKICDGAGACKTTAGNACGIDSDCISGICYAGICRVQTNGACTDDFVCGSGLCSASTCIDCIAGNQCKSKMCDSLSCKAPGGAPCGANEDCAGGQCQFNLCLLNNAQACTTNADCRSGYCNSGTCAQCNNNGNCSGNAVCTTTTFGANTCERPSGGYCINNFQCAAAGGAMCLGFPGKCQ